MPEDDDQWGALFRVSQSPGPTKPRFEIGQVVIVDVRSCDQQWTGRVLKRALADDSWEYVVSRAPDSDEPYMQPLITSLPLYAWESELTAKE